MKNVKLNVLFLFFFSLVLSTSYASTQGHGTVSMNGEIIDTACAISMESKEQTIDMGILPLGIIRNQGEGNYRDVDIYLINCDLDKSAKPGKPMEQWSMLQMTFDGESDNGLFKIFGDASGVGIYMEDENNRHVIPGDSLPGQEIIPSTMRLRYKLKLVSNNKPLRAGAYQSSIRFKVDYY